MSKADDLFEYSQYDDDIDDLHKLLKNLMNEYLKETVRTIEDLSEEDIKELAHYFLYFSKTHGKERISYDASIDKIKAFFLLFSKMSNDENADRILSYLEPMEAGWHDGKYYLSNSCLDRCLYANMYKTSQKGGRRSDEDILLEVIMWTLPQEKIANSRIQRKYGIGNERTIRILDRMEDMGLISRKNENLGWEVIPECFEDIPSGVLSYLGEKGISEARIRAVFR